MQSTLNFQMCKLRFGTQHIAIQHTGINVCNILIKKTENTNLRNTLEISNKTVNQLLILPSVSS